MQDPAAFGGARKVTSTFDPIEPMGWS